MGLTISQVDAFTETPFAGNPAGVCVLPEARDARWMQNVAQEMNLSETAFLVGHDGDFNLRWFTPAVEVDLCGHATLASAHVLWEMGYVQGDEQIRFHTKSGLLTAKRKNGWIELNFPTREEDPVSTPPTNLLKALGVTAPLYVGKDRTEQFDYIVEVESEEIVRSLQPDYALLATVPGRGVIVTSRAATDSYDFVSRFFGPQVGVNEDPVTGSAHCCLAPYWTTRLGKKELVGYQASERGGIVLVRVENDRVCLGGKAVTVIRGELVG